MLRKKRFGSGLSLGNSRPKGTQRRFSIERLEERCVLALLGAIPDFPKIDFNNIGTVQYDADTDSFGVLHAIPFSLTRTMGGPPTPILPSGSDWLFEIHLNVDSTGTLVSGVPGDDLLVQGSVTVDGNTASGNLLTGEITAFGFGETGSRFDFTFEVSGGLLSSGLTELYGVGTTVAVFVESENSDYTGDFTVDFTGGAKGQLGTGEDEEPGIELEKLTNGHDADTVEEAPLIFPGDLVTWTYKVTNTGNVDFTAADIEIVDDAGTPGDLSDDFSTTTGDIVLDVSSDVGSDGILSPGEMWIYEASAIAEDLLAPVGPPTVFDLSGNSGLDGIDGNIRTYTADGISVNASAFSRDSGGVWEEAFLGAYSSGLGVTDTGEGGGGGGSHRVDNVGRDNYVLFEFSESVVIDSAFLDSVVNDSDISVWIGDLTDPFNNHAILSDALLGSLGFTEVNNTTSSGSRLADINAGLVSGNVLVIAASTSDNTPDDKFKIKTLKITHPGPGCYENYAVVTADGVSDDDPSHYCTEIPEPGIKLEKHTNGVDADTEAVAPEIAPGDLVTWTYYVENTGNVPYDQSEVEIVDDAGTPGDLSDDFSTTSGDIVLDVSSDVGSDGVLSPGEVWVFEASAVAENLTVPAGPSTTFDFSGNSGTRRDRRQHSFV